MKYVKPISTSEHISGSIAEKCRRAIGMMADCAAGTSGHWAAGQSDVVLLIDRAGYRTNKHTHWQYYWYWKCTGTGKRAAGPIYQ